MVYLDNKRINCTVLPIIYTDVSVSHHIESVAFLAYSAASLTFIFNTKLEILSVKAGVFIEHLLGFLLCPHSSSKCNIGLMRRQKVKTFSGTVI